MSRGFNIVLESDGFEGKYHLDKTSASLEQARIEFFNKEKEMTWELERLNNLIAQSKHENNCLKISLESSQILLQSLQEKNKKFKLELKTHEFKLKDFYDNNFESSSSEASRVFIPLEPKTGKIKQSKSKKKEILLLDQISLLKNIQEKQESNINLIKNSTDRLRLKESQIKEVIAKIESEKTSFYNETSKNLDCRPNSSECSLHSISISDQVFKNHSNSLKSKQTSQKFSIKSYFFFNSYIPYLNL